MKKNSALLVAGLVFTIVAILHALRMYYNVEVVVNGYSLPDNASIIGLVVAAILAIWMFMARKSNR